jgi:transposase
MQAQSVNINDVEGFKKIVKSHVSSLKAAQKCRYLVADAALYVKGTIVELNALRQLFIARVPQKLKEAKTLIQSASLLTFEPICDGYQGVWHTSHYGDVEQKWLLIRSEQATKREHHTLNSRMLKQAEGSRKTFKNYAIKRLLVAQMPMQRLSNGRKNKPHWQSKPQCLKYRFTKARGDLIQINNPFAPIIKSAERYTRHWKSAMKPPNSLACLSLRPMILRAH